MFTSKCELLGDVTFPEFTGERIYMKKFYKNKGLPNEYKRWQPTIDQMLDKIDIDEPIYLMVDQGIVQPNTAHRREGVHIDGYWIDTELYGMGRWDGSGRWNDKALGFHSAHRSRISAHGGSSHGYTPPSSHRPMPSHGGTAYIDRESPYTYNQHGVITGRNPNCPKTPRTNTHGVIIGWDDPRSHVPDYDSHGNVRGWKKNPNQKFDSVEVTSDWSDADLLVPESLILASDFAACKGYLGEWTGAIGNGGDCSKVDLSGMTEILLEANKAYKGNVGFLHESTPIHVPTQRTLVRLNLKGQ